MTLKQLDQILGILESKIMARGAPNQNNLARCNLNLIKCTLQLYAILHKIVSLWSKCKLRTNSLKMKILD